MMTELPPPSAGSTFLKIDPQHFASKRPLLDHQNERINHVWATLFVRIAPLLVPFAFYALPSPIKNLALAWVLCTLCIQEPISENDCMQCTCNFLNFVCRVSSLCPSCFTHPFFQFLMIFLKMCSPPSAGSIILKGASIKNHEKGPSRTPI